METFQLLSRGGVKFNKNRFASDASSSNDIDRGKSRELSSSQLPPELDFFRYAKNTSLPSNDTSKRKLDTQTQNETDEKSIDGKDSETFIPMKKRRKNSPEISGDEGETSSDVKKSKKQRVTSKGNNIPIPLESFEELTTRYDFPSRMLQNMGKNGWIEPTGIQAHGIPMILESRDLAAISPTGTGKTLTYLLPIIFKLHAPISQSIDHDVGKGVRALILAPTRELAHQIYNESLKICEGRKWRVVLYSKASAATLADKGVRDKTDILISTPLRLVASLKEKKIDLDNVRHLVLDEADRMLDTEFLSQVNEIVASCPHGSLQTSVFSATLPGSAEQVAMKMLKDPIRVIVGLKDTPLPSIRQSLVYVADETSKLPSLISYLTSTSVPSTDPAAPPSWAPPILIFTSTQSRATSLYTNLMLYNLPNVDVLHASLSNAQRMDVIRRMREGKCWILVCTKVMARGMDFKGIRGVINYDIPNNVQSYVHRIGRTGRAGRDGFAITYWTDEDGPYMKTLANVLLQSGSHVPEWMLKLPKPSQLKRRQMGRAKRGDEVTAASRIGKMDSVKKRDMILASKRRKGNVAEKKDGSCSIDEMEWSGFNT
ncbi:hypothetical protein Clacol_008184 [Clathrus columnatus]|uniref:RNA helicase n=1 Tax=Clathrus columnatus TaxID=1419009 RepID=A0AAV5AJJ4_9AGAM|nr:hypothetical protein Clacol_008184 [Clathrus columnatus]